MEVGELTGLVIDAMELVHETWGCNEFRRTKTDLVFRHDGDFATLFEEKPEGRIVYIADLKEDDGPVFIKLGTSEQIYLVNLCVFARELEEVVFYQAYRSYIASNNGEFLKKFQNLFFLPEKDVVIRIQVLITILQTE